MIDAMISFLIGFGITGIIVVVVILSWQLVWWLPFALVFCPLAGFGLWMIGESIRGRL